MSTKYDAIIIGGGPNGLLAGAYLAKIGHKGLSMWGFGLAFVGLILGGFAIM